MLHISCVLRLVFVGSINHMYYILDRDEFPIISSEYYVRVF